HPRHRGAGREDRDVEPGGISRGGILDDDVLTAERQRRAGAALGCEEADVGDREVALHEEAAHDGADLTGGADDAETNALIAHPAHRTGERMWLPACVRDARCRSGRRAARARSARRRRRGCRLGRSGGEGRRRRGGKQDWELEPHVIWYSRTSGIWQPIWLES